MKIFLLLLALLTLPPALYAEEQRLLIFGNSYSHFFEYLPDIAASKGDSVVLFPMRNSNAARTLCEAEEKIARGDLQPISAVEAGKLLQSGDPESAAWGLDCWQNLFAYIPEHPRVDEAKAVLEKAGKLDAAQALARTELRERPGREAFLKKCWDSGGPLRKTDNKKEGRWEDL